MVSFVCDGCQDTMKRNKLVQHMRHCCPSVSCVDCGKQLNEEEAKKHQQCMTEVHKTAGALAKERLKAQMTYKQVFDALVNQNVSLDKMMDSPEAKALRPLQQRKLQKRIKKRMK